MVQNNNDENIENDNNNDNVYNDNDNLYTV